MSRVARRVLVVGGTGTIGRAVVRALCERGDHVVTVARIESSLRELAQDVSRCVPDAVIEWVAQDLTADGAPSLVVQKASALGPIHDLVLCFGPFVREPLAGLGAASLRALFNVHAAAPMLLVRDLEAPLRKSCGAVVALSDEGVARPYPNHAAYLAAKGALEAGMRALAVELAPDIRVNLLRVGVVTDPGQEGDAARLEHLSARSLMRRFGTGAEVANVVLTMLDATWMAGQVWTMG